MPANHGGPEAAPERLQTPPDFSGEAHEKSSLSIRYRVRHPCYDEDMSTHTPTTTTNTFIHRTVNGEGRCDLMANDAAKDIEADTDTRFRATTHVHVKAESIGKSFDHFSTARSNAEMAATSPGHVIVPVGESAVLLMDPATARKLARTLNAVAKAAEKLAAEEA